MKKLDLIRRGILSGLLALPLLAQAQAETAPSPLLSSHPTSEVDGWTRSLLLGVRSHPFDFDRRRAEVPLFTVSLEQQLLRYLSVYAGGHLGTDLDTKGGQVGTRLFFSQTFNEGVFVSGQASYSLFDADRYTEGNRTALGGLVGYSHAMGRRWLVSVGGGAQFVRVRTTTTPPSTSAPCIFLYCKQEVPTLPSTSETESVEPLL